jgi:hypothetical protein
LDGATIEAVDDRAERACQSRTEMMRRLIGIDLAASDPHSDV